MVHQSLIHKYTTYKILAKYISILKHGKSNILLKRRYKCGTSQDTDKQYNVLANILLLKKAFILS